jgi:hypothetical protein
VQREDMMGLISPKPLESGAWKPQELENITFTDGSWVSMVAVIAMLAALLALVLW